MVKSDLTFKGPIFVVGMPRSGTKLLRELLNRNSRIGIVEEESNFLPWFIKRWGHKPLDASEQKQFYTAIQATNLVWNQKQHHQRDFPDFSIEPDQAQPLSDLVEKVFRCYGPKKEPFIWGDKTPGYLRHIALLKSQFPSARFVHIIRDPRDLCLSVNNAWKKSRRHAVQRWFDNVKSARQEGASLGSDYMEIRYEDLLCNPKEKLSEICAFLGVPFEEEMLYLIKPSEDLGETKGKLEIVQKNFGKFKQRLTPKKIAQLEAIAYPALKDLGYELHGATTHRPLNLFQRAAFWCYDKVVSARFHIRDKGLVSGLRYAIRLQKHSPW